MVAVMFIQFALFPPEVLHAAAKAVSTTAVNYGQDTHLWWHSSGWAARYERLRNEFLPNIGAQAQPRGWDGKGAPRHSRPAPQAVETQQDREQKIARVKIFPGDVEIKTGEQVVFSAVAFDHDGNPVGGVDVKWDALDEVKNQPLTISSPGTFVSGVPGRFIVTAEVAGRREHVKVTVTGETRVPNLKSRSEESKSSRESRRVGSLRAPVQGDQARIARRSNHTRMPALPGLRAASAPMAARPALQNQGEDWAGWNCSNNDTADDVGSERGHVAGRAVDGGAGSSNFQFAAPAVLMDGRGIDLSLLFNYNSRVWHKAGSDITFDIDRDTLVPGWNLGFGKIVMACDSYMLIDSDGTRHPYEGTLRRNFPSPVSALQSFEAHTTDGTFIDYYAEGYQPQFDNSGGRNMIVAWAVLPDGTRIEYGAKANYAMYPTRITDAHGNFITITYLNNEGPKIQTITDTLGRVVYFNYDLQGLLTSIVVPGLNGGSRVAVRLQYQWLKLSDTGPNYGFASGLTTKVRQNPIPVVKAIYYPGTGTGYWFGDGDSYSPYGMIRKLIEHRGMSFDNAPLDQQGNIGPGVMSREMVYDYPQSGGSYSDMPTYTRMTEDWAGRSTDAPPETYFSVADSGWTRTTTITRPDGAQVRQFTNNDQSSVTYGMVVRTALYQGGVALSDLVKNWEIGAYHSPRLSGIIEYNERGRQTSTYYFYDWNFGSRYNSVTETREYEGNSSSVLRRTHFEYLNDGNYNGALQNSGTLWARTPGALSAGPIWVGSHIFNLVSATEVYEGDNITRLSRTEYQYDGRDLRDNPGIVQYNSWYNPHTPPREVCGLYPDPTDPDCNGRCDPSCIIACPPRCDGNCDQIYRCNTYLQYDPATLYRGNVTQIKRYADAVNLDQGTAVVETRTYDIAGNVREQTPSCCEKTTFTYTPNTQYSWPESQTSGSPSDATKQNGASATYDYWTGLIMTSTDANGRSSQTVYDSNTLRLVYEYLPTGAYQYHVYDDLNLYVANFVYEAGQSGGNFASRGDNHFDGLGRVVKKVAYGKDHVWDVVETKYDDLGRVWRQSRPYRYGAEPPQWSTVVYDSLSRPVQTVSPDGSVVTRAYNPPDPPGSSGQPGPSVKVTDPWGRERWARSDALGRLVEVAEPNSGGNGSLSGGAIYTAYSYDALDRLIQVNQGAQTRLFRYDSLGRLTHQKLAERDSTLNDNGQWVGNGLWSDVFFYDTRSNLVRRVDARGVQTHYNFNDPLNRLLSVVYDKSGSPFHLSVYIPDAPNVSYGYVTSGDKTRAETVFVSNGMGNEQLSYDSEGRLAQSRQTFAGREGYPILTSYIWDTLDRLKESAYPQQYGAGEVRKKVEPAYDIASRIESLKFGGVTYASNPVYNAASQTTSFDVGAQIKEIYGYDPKTGLMTDQQVKRGADLLVDLKYNYTLNNDSNNNGAKTGQLTSLTDLKNQARNRAYEYDKLGRLGKVKGGVDAFNNPAWYQNYSNDRYGNRSMVEQNGEAVWMDDGAPAGASLGYDGGDNWDWRGYSPAPYSGSVSHQSMVAAGAHQHFFTGAAQTLQVGAGEKVYAYVYLDPANTPSEVMLQWCSNESGWGHRAYWGANNIQWGTDGTAERKYMGPLPAAGGWVKLEVPASAVGLEGKTAHGMAFTLYGGRANWDQAGKANSAGVTVWVDDSLPAEAVGNEAEDSWKWVSGPSPNQYSGAVSHQSGLPPNVHQHFFYRATQTLQINAGDKLYAYVHLDPANKPSAVMLQWNASTLGNDGTWEHRAYWGVNAFPWGTDGTNSKRYMGPLPAAGGWVRLEVPASAVGLEGMTLNGMAFSLYDGRANWDQAGKASGAADTAWMDDSPPAGAILGTEGGDSWTWVSQNPSPYSGAVSHQSGIPAGVHQHFFWGATQTLQVNAGDKLYAHVYLDPANTPSEVMLQWNDGVWEHRAYWGANNIGFGVDGTESRRYMGPLPAAGGWVKLEVPVSAVGLEGKTLNGMAFTLYGGRAWWDKAGKTRGIASSVPLDGLANIGYNTANNRINTPGFEYDPAGNQTRAVVDASGRQQVYRYDCAGRLAHILDSNQTEVAVYGYGAGNQRLMSVEGGVVKYFAWDGGKIIAEYEGSGANALVWKTSYVYLGGQLLATTSGIDGTETRFHHPDRLGTRLVTDAAGTVVSEQFSLPFGTMLPFTQVYGGENSYQHPLLSNPSKKRFTSYDRSDATGLDYAVNRFYSPQQGRFTQVDPIEMGAAELANPQSLNLYAYVENDPINSSDPLGLDGTIVFRPFPVPTGGGGGGGLRIGPFSFSFSFGGGSFLNFGSLQQSKGKRQAGVSSKTIKGGTVASPLSGTIWGNVDAGGGFGVQTDGPSDDEILNDIQTALDVFGLIPGVGEFADAGSAYISYKRGDHIGVGLSVWAMIPIGGQWATAAKFARRAKKAARGASRLLGNVGAHAFGRTVFTGLAQNRPLRELTDTQIRAAFKGTPFTPSNHAISRLLHQRTAAMGVGTLNDVAAVLNNGIVSNAGGGLVSIQRGGFEAIVNPVTNVIVTFSPR
jgi:RHS repeat-associated protein